MLSRLAVEKGLRFKHWKNSHEDLNFNFLEKSDPEEPG